MAHECPECGMLCHCNGDIDDIDFGSDCKGAEECVHYLCPSCDGYEGREDEDDFWCGGDDSVTPT